MANVFNIICSTSLKRVCTRFITQRQLATLRQTRESSFPKVAKPKTYLIVGLGNHDQPNTRHSVGMRVLDKFAGYLDMNWTADVKNCVGVVSKTQLADDVEVVLLKPKMPMNVNGTSVARTVSYFDISPENVYLIHDDIDKRFGKVAFKPSGSACGHNGVRSVLNSLGTDEISRLRIGIDCPTDRNDMNEHVFSDFSTEESGTLDTVVDDCLHALANHLAKKSGVHLPEPITAHVTTT